MARNQDGARRPLRTVVCIKPVPDPRQWDKIGLDPQTNLLQREGIPSVINPLDKNALEEALSLRDSFGGTVTVLSMAPPAATEALYAALAMGADEATLLSDRALGGADTLATSYTLAAGIAKLEGVDIVLCGNKSLDGSTGQVAPQLAEFLSCAHVIGAVALEVCSDNVVHVKSKMDFGYLTIEATMPVVIAVRAEINTPRLTSLPGILAARSKEIRIWTVADLGVDTSKVGLAGSPTRVAGVFVPKVERRGETLSGEPDSVSELLIDRLKQLGMAALR